MTINETDTSVKGAIESGGNRGSDHQPPRRRSTWKAQLIGAAIGLVIFIVIVGIFYLLYGRFH